METPDRKTNNWTELADPRIYQHLYQYDKCVKKNTSSFREQMLGHNISSHSILFYQGHNV